MSGYCCSHWHRCLSRCAGCGVNVIDRSLAVCLGCLGLLTLVLLIKVASISSCSCPHVKTSKADINMDNPRWSFIHEYFTPCYRNKGSDKDISWSARQFVTDEHHLASFFCFLFICCSSRSSVLYLAWCSAFCCFLLTESMPFLLFYCIFLYFN